MLLEMDIDPSHLEVMKEHIFSDDSEYCIHEIGTKPKLPSAIASYEFLIATKCVELQDEFAKHAPSVQFDEDNQFDYC